MKRFCLYTAALLLAIQFVLPISSAAAHSYYGNKNQLNAEELQQKAARLGDKMIGGTATVVDECNIRIAPNENAYLIGKGFVGEFYPIVDYIFSSYGSVWIRLQYEDEEVAWVSASYVDVEPSAAQNASGEHTWLIGRTCRITATSGRARLTPGTDGYIVAYVHANEKYTILDCDAAADGKLWYKIQIENQECWISSGMASLN